jgi:hypothetical protein
MDQLLGLLTLEQAKELRFCADRPPVVVSEEEEHSLQGPPLTSEDLSRLWRSLAGSREIRYLREQGTVQFVYTTAGRAPFLVRAKLEGNRLVFDVS